MCSESGGKLCKHNCNQRKECSTDRKESGRTGDPKMILELALESCPDIKGTGNE